MNSTAELMALLAEWRLFSEQEHAAILEEDWDRLARHQASKSRLSAQITEALTRFRAQPVAGQVQAQVNACGSELIALEMRNSELLQNLRHTRAAERERLNETNRNLQGVRRAYGGISGHLLQSYS
jgi:hypothetical protein